MNLGNQSVVATGHDQSMPTFIYATKQGSEGQRRQPLFSPSWLPPLNHVLLSLIYLLFYHTSMQQQVNTLIKTAR